MTFISCKEKTTYGFGMSIKNELVETICIELYPKIYPWDYQTELNIESGRYASIFWSNETEVSILDKINETFDSLRINIPELELTIIFRPDISIHYLLNPYKDNTAWDQRIVKGNEYTMFSTNPIETEDHYIRINNDYIVEQ